MGVRCRLASAAMASGLGCANLDLVTFLDPPATAAWRHLDSRAGFEVVYFRADDHAITLEGVTRNGGDRAGTNVGGRLHDRDRPELEDRAQQPSAVVR